MKKTYSDFWEMIALGHNAGLSPEEIYARFKAAGLHGPPPHIIRKIGIQMMGWRCRWNPARCRVWHNPKS